MNHVALPFSTEEETEQLTSGAHALLHRTGPWDIGYDTSRTDVYTLVDVREYVIASEYTGKHREENIGNNDVFYYSEYSEVWVRVTDDVPEYLYGLGE